MRTFRSVVYWTVLEGTSRASFAMAGLLAAAIILAAAQPLFGSVYTWNGSGSGAGDIFDVSTNWGGTLPSATGDTALWNGANAPTWAAL